MDKAVFETTYYHTAHTIYAVYYVQYEFMNDLQHLQKLKYSELTKRKNVSHNATM